ncbi:MAG: right-handed parallel beta-helix repeat-containing protein [Ignavibacteriaceae bacterium]|nr:right-handed parallel beta-helix repeat-containing protein [Ignavibacteriaceae bacterium]
MKRFITPLVISFLLLFLFSCIEFQTINQPAVSLPNEIITVYITATTEGGAHEPYLGVCLPVGWTISGDSMQCSGGYNEAIHYNDSLSVEQENVSPAEEGYYWWVGKGVADTTAVGLIYGELRIQNDSQMGTFLIDYMLGDSYHSVNYQRNDDHQIEVVEEHTPYGLQVTLEGEYVVISWNEPLNTNELMGYVVYRDEQPLFPGVISDTTFTDLNPLEGIHYYCVSSLDNNYNEYMIPYELHVVFKNLFVSPNGSNSNYGSSFSDALLTLNFAISVISGDASNHVDIFLSPGTYSENTNGEEFPINCKDYIKIIGSGEDETIISGDTQNGVIGMSDLNNISIEGITITNGYGGLSCHNSGLQLKNVTLTNNHGAIGGGIYLYRALNVSITNVAIINNSASGCGGGIYMSSHSNPLIENVIICNNSGWGGGIYCVQSSDPQFINTTIANNSGGGIYIKARSDVFLNNCILSNNPTYEIEFHNLFGGSVTINYSDINGEIFKGISGIVYWLEGNINQNPLFNDAEFPYTLSNGSPCIDEGNPDPIYNDPEDPNNPGYAFYPAMGTIRNDMGAYGGPNTINWIVTDVENDEKENSQTPNEFKLSQNFPNPFNPKTTIQYSIKERTPVELVLYDILGRVVEVLVNEEQDAGYYKVDFIAGNLASGIYLYRLKVGDFIETKKMLLIK